MKINFSIKLKIFLNILFFFSVMITINMLYDISESKNQLNKYLYNLNHSSAKLLKNNIQSDMYGLNYTNIKNTIDTFDNSYFKNIYILNKNGYIFAQRNRREITFNKHGSFDALIKNEKQNQFLYFLPIDFSNKIIGYIIIENSHELIKEIIHSKENKILKIFFIMLFVTIIFSSILSFVITRPIFTIINKINSINKNDHLTFNNTSKDEFAYLSKVIEENHNKVQSMNEQLEETVQIEVKKNKEKDFKLFEQTKMASLGEMIGNIAHQWRQPLSIITTAATGMSTHKKLGILEDEFFNNSCETINKNAQYLSQTIDDFKNFIKGDRIKIIFNLTNEINSLLELLKGMLKDNNINIVLDIKNEIYINGYKNELIQALINIVNNSKDALLDSSIENKYIFISTLEVEGKVIILLKDNGGGVPEDIISKIFEPYFTTKHQSQGTGLGLHMTYNLIVEGMKGTIDVKNVKYIYNNNEYSGAEFSISIPIN